LRHVGHDNLRARLSSLSTLPPSALLIEGPEGVGKRDLARHWACQVLAEPGVCGEDLTDLEARLIRGDLLDYTEPEPDGSYKIDQIREAMSWSRRAPMKYRHRVVCIPSAGMLTQQACDALLKTVEEPPERTRFVLTLDEGHELAETLRARCRVEWAGRLSDEAMAGVITQIVVERAGREPNEEQIAALVSCCRGVPGKVDFYVGRGWKMRRELTELVCRLPQTADWSFMALVDTYLNQDDVEPADWVAVIEDVARELVESQTGVNTVFPGVDECARRLGHRVFDIALKSRVLSQLKDGALDMRHQILSCLLQIKEVSR